MKPFLFLSHFHGIAAAFLLVLTTAWARNPDAGFPKTAEVRTDRTVAFRLVAPQAESVTLKGEIVEGKAPMTKNEEGTWEVIVGPVEPGIYSYHFDVDGVYSLDPHNRWIKGWRRSANLVEVPGDPPKSWQVQKVPHGTISQLIYHSKPLGTEREALGLPSSLLRAE